MNIKKLYTLLLTVVISTVCYAQIPIYKLVPNGTTPGAFTVFVEYTAAGSNVRILQGRTTFLYNVNAGTPTITSVQPTSGYSVAQTFTQAQINTAATCGGGVGNPNNPNGYSYFDVTNGASTITSLGAVSSGDVDTLFRLQFPTTVSSDSVRLLNGINGTGGNTFDNCLTGTIGLQSTWEYHMNGGTPTVTAIDQTSSTLPLPVELLYLTADWQGEDAVVEWETASELNNSHFDVERSFDGSGFEYIGTVGSQATGGNSNQRLVYTYTDLGAKARTMKNVFYRLIQTDFDGASEVFGPALLRVNRTTETSIALFPVPAQNQVTVQTIGLDEGVNYTLRVIGNLGNTVQESTFLSGRSYNKTILDISSLPSGVYRVTVEGGNLQGEVEKFIKID